MPAREDLFTPVHKALRTMIYGLSARLQTNDFADLDGTERLLTDLENDFAVARTSSCILCVLSQHALDEERAIFPPAAKHANALITRLIEEHHDLTRRELGIAEAGHAILDLASPAARVEAGIRLNQAANELFGAYLTHMNREEAELVPRMREQFTDAQMAAMRGAILRNLPPDRLFAILGWMLPSLNVTELSEFLSGLRQSAPPPLVQAVCTLCDAQVDPGRWSEVKLRAGI